MVAWDNLGAGDCYKRPEVDGVRCAIGYPRFSNREGWLDVVEDRTWLRQFECDFQARTRSKIARFEWSRNRLSMFWLAFRWF